MPQAKTIAKSTGFLFSTEIINKLMSLFLVIIITRYLGDIGFGKYAFAFAFVGLFIVFSHFGLTAYIFREISKDKSKAKKLVDNVFTMKLFILALLYPIITVVAWNLPKTKEIIFILLLIMFHELFTILNTMIELVFKAHEQNEYNVYFAVIDKGLALLLGAYVLIIGHGLYALLSVMIIAKIVSFIVHYLACYKKFITISFDFDFNLWKSLIKNSFPFWVTRIFQVIYYQIDKVMLTAMKGYAVTGWYSAASKLISALTFIPIVIATAAFPAMSRFHHQNSKDFLKLLYRKTFYYLLSIAIPLSIGISLLSQRLIIYIYKDQFIKSGIVLNILSWSFIFIFANAIMGYLLNSINKQHVFSICTLTCAVSNVILNFALIPKLSYIGAALATVTTQAINFSLLYYFTTKNGYPINIIKISYKPLIAGILMGILIFYIKFLPVIYIIPIAAIFYFTTLFLIGGIGKEEIDLIKSFFPKKS